MFVMYYICGRIALFTYWTCTVRTVNAALYVLAVLLGLLFSTYLRLGYYKWEAGFLPENTEAAVEGYTQWWASSFRKVTELLYFRFW